MFFSNSKSVLKISPKNKTYSVLGTKNNIILLTGYLISLPICTLITLSLLLRVFSINLFTPIESSHYSTSIPWIDDPSECEYTGRNWRDRKCWDDEHNPMF
ncbi:hypothetical protein FACHB389_35450 [Nostoc calcicola FACHB-389]|nr:hypothetical protein FACHB389_35450 [Nostoc calcicola FACHB-389]